MEKFINLVKKEPMGEKQTLSGFPAIRSVNPYYVDMRSKIDDKTVLANPHKGWFWHYVDNGFSSPLYRSKHDTDDALYDFPGLNHLYIRFDWCDVEKEKGIYDFTPIDEIMELWGARGYRFSLRVCTFEVASYPQLTTPAYVFEEGARCYLLPGNCIQPDYSDPVFLHHLENFMRAFGEKYNGDPRIEYIDVGTYGTWGEGHTVFGEERIYPADVIKTHFDLHAKYFPDTYILCNDDHIMAHIGKDQEAVLELAEYADARGFGLQDDSIALDLYTRDNSYDTLRAPWLFERLKDNAPNVMEFCHYSYYKENGDKTGFRSGFGIIEGLKKSHATYAGFHGYPREWLPEQRYLTEYCANRLGYWYFLMGATVWPLTNTAHNKMILEIENRGWARAFYRYDMKIMLRKNEEESYIIDVEADNRQWLPEQLNQVCICVDCRNVPGGEYELSIGLFEQGTPIRLALKEAICHEGFYTICRTSVKEI